MALSSNSHLDSICLVVYFWCGGRGMHMHKWLIPLTGNCYHVTALAFQRVTGKKSAECFLEFQLNVSVQHVAEKCSLCTSNWLIEFLPSRAQITLCFTVLSLLRKSPTLVWPKDHTADWWVIVYFLHLLSFFEAQTHVLTLQNRKPTAVFCGHRKTIYVSQLHSYCRKHSTVSLWRLSW